MNITNRQVQGEIDELIAEANRRVALVNGIFSKSAQLTKQAELLKQFLALRTETKRR